MKKNKVKSAMKDLEQLDFDNATLSAGKKDKGEVVDIDYDPSKPLFAFEPQKVGDTGKMGNPKGKPGGNENPGMGGMGMGNPPPKGRPGEGGPGEGYGPKPGPGKGNMGGEGNPGKMKGEGMMGGGEAGFKKKMKLKKKIKGKKNKN